jgi:hypothetical protein
LIQLCREVRRPIPLERLERLLHSGLGSRYVLVQVGDDGAVYFREVGRGFPWFEERWVSQARGLRMQDQPDYYIGRWAAQTYRMVARERAPTLDDIDAITDTPHLGRSRIRYTRLIVPVAAPWGESCLLGACVINPQIDLRAGGSLQ